MRALDMFFAILVVAIWGGNFVAAKYGIEHFAPFFLTALRFMATAALLLPFAPVPTKAQAIQILKLATTMGVLHFAMLFAALYHGLDIASCAIVGQLGVPFSCLLGAILLKDRLGAWRLFGMVVAFIGMIIVAGTPNIVEHPTGFFIGMAGAFFWALGNVLLKAIKEVPIFQMLAWMSLFAVPQLLIVSFIFESGQWERLQVIPPHVALSLAYTVIGSTIMAYGMWYRLMRIYPVTQVAPFSLLAPVFGIASGQVFFGEELSWQVLSGGALTIIGVAVIVLRRPKLFSFGKPT